MDAEQELTDTDLELITGGKTALTAVGVGLTAVSIWQRYRLAKEVRVAK